MQNSSKVLLIHGLTGSPSEMEYLASFLKQNHFEPFLTTLSGHDSTLTDLRFVSTTKWLEDAEGLLRQIPSDNSVHLIGQSYGSWLCLHLATKFPERISSITLIAPPYKFRSMIVNFGLEILAYLPDFILNLLPYKKKRTDRPGHPELPYRCYDSYPVGSAARVVQTKRRFLPLLSKISAPILILQDPNEHLVHPNSSNLFKRLLEEHNKKVQYVEIPGGEHELTVGKCYNDVYQNILLFLRKVK